ncbi:hypothetical protein SO694_00046169 [Aureococcus anophagefferens]|uniref:Uncharacterized protein n=1 Tax=Aureococcus anophagefferens TaxID=44056 RepID=A0ABR1G7Z5_AURAN
MDLAARKRAWTGSVARPGDVAVLSNCEDDDSRRWVVDAALGASGASGVAFDGGNDVNLCGDLLACLTFDDHERLADDDAAFAEARGPGVWALVDDLRAKVGVCRARGDLKLFLPLRKLRDAAPRLDDADLDALAAPSDDLGVVDVDGPAERRGARPCSSASAARARRRPPAGAKAMALFDAAGAFLGAPRPAGDAADRARDEIFRAADAPALERRAGRARAAYLRRRRQLDAAFVGAAAPCSTTRRRPSRRGSRPRRRPRSSSRPTRRSPRSSSRFASSSTARRARVRATANADLDTALAWCVGHAGDADFAAPPAPAPAPPPDDAGDRRARRAGRRRGGALRPRARDGRPGPRGARCAAQLADLERKAGELDAASKLRAALLGAAAPRAPSPAAPPQPKEALARLFGGDEPAPASAFEGALSRLADATFCRVAQEHGLLLRRFARATKALGRSVGRPLSLRGESPPARALARRRRGRGGDARGRPRPGARRPTQEEKRRDAALASLRAIATKDTAPLLADRRWFAGAVSPAEVYACAARREAFHALEGDAGDLERAAAERAAPLFARRRRTSGVGRRAAKAFFENFGGESLEPLGRLAAGLAGRVGAPLEPRLRSIRSSLEALGLAAGFGTDAAKATRDAARMAVTAGGDPALAFLLLGRRRRWRSDERAAPPEAATREAFANAAAALVLGPLFGDGEDGDRSLSRDDARTPAPRPRAAPRRRAGGDPEGAAGFAGALAGALARRGELVRDGDDEDSSAERLRALGVLDGLARARARRRRRRQRSPTTPPAPPPAEAPAHPCFFAVSELVARGWGAERARHVAAGDLATASTSTSTASPSGSAGSSCSTRSGRRRDAGGAAAAAAAGGRPDRVGEARLYAALPPGAARFKAGLRAAHASVRWAARDAYRQRLGLARRAGGDLGDDLLRSGAALAAMDAGGDGRVACVVLAAAARRHHGDFLAVARAAHAFAGTPPHRDAHGPPALRPRSLLGDGGAARGWDAWPELRDAAAAALAAYADPAG